MRGLPPAKIWAAALVWERCPDEDKIFSANCRACLHPDGRLWPWPQLRSCMRRLWSYRSTSSLGSDRPWWRCSTRPGLGHHQEPAWSRRSVWLPCSWVREQRAEWDWQEPLLELLELLEPQRLRAQHRWTHTRSSLPCGRDRHRFCWLRSSKTRHYIAR